jgi:hypothetical protein
MKLFYNCLLAVICFWGMQGEGALTEPAYAQLSTFTTQLPVSLGDSKVRLEVVDAIKNVELSSQKEEIIIKKDGVYFFLFSAQGGAITPGARGHVDVWLIKNNIALPNSGSRLTIENTSTTGSLISQYVLMLKNGDTISLGFSASGPGLGLIFIQPDNQPAIPSLCFSLFKIDQGFAN